MSTHSALDDLSALAEALAAGDSLPPACAEALEHCAACPACDVVLQRLRAGVSLLDEARAHTPPMPDWEAIDPHIARAAEDTARQIRAGRLRAPSRWREPVAVGFGFDEHHRHAMAEERVVHPLAGLGTGEVSPVLGLYPGWVKG